MSKVPPNIQPPTPEEIRELAAEHYMDLTDEEVQDFEELIAATLAGYERLDELSVTDPALEYTNRDPGYKPDIEEDPLNAFVRKCEVKGAESGPLAEYDVGLKDNISLAGVEMTCGSKLFEGYVPETDATVVTRLLDAGATITGKLNMEDMAFSGSGELSATGPVRNPHDPDYIAGGSSSGSIAAVVNEDVDVAMGGDQGGSVRIPAAWSGGVGHKPTHSLVPYTGIAGLGRSFDHTGPMTRSVSDCARVLEVIAGKDPGDPRQGNVPTDNYTDALDGSAADITVGVVEEGFGHDQSEPGVDSTVRNALASFEAAGADVQEVSIPMHLDGLPIWNAIATEGTMATVEAEGVGYNANGHYDTQFMEAFARARRSRADDYLTTVKLTLITGQYLSDTYNSHYYAKAQNLSQELASRYDSALADVDVLAMPTTPQTAHEYRSDLSRMEVVDRALNMLPNTAPFDVTGHPALSVPAGTSNGLPVGLMFVGDQFDDATVLQAGHAFEQSVEPNGL
ncbi:amidase [Halonotius pteroides]|uniref:Asp-tRNA(Asn)/Glu-tRNA(Gln) amidotransferase GatCAB subunit A n=1 Tax=Halonotius pteroides TaxID=268735 RepID=A0A3A6PX47_9EURY|nr:amidase [Halonotius pteroides]RJX47674.1 Asp-tRNA(Asn)/Glu-tRNA(Gln) amidotransferase GatCAB subunit A [Halonotius pteroides]